MAIELKPMFDDVAERLGRGSGSRRLEQSFPRAVNRALDGLSLAADLATRHSHVSGSSESVSTLDAEYEPLLYAGVMYWLVRMGHTPSDPRLATALLKETDNAWEDAQGRYWEAELNATQATSTNDVIGLGDLS